MVEIESCFFFQFLIPTIHKYYTDLNPTSTMNKINR